jgi:hypothetical protein
LKGGQKKIANKQGIPSGVMSAIMWAIGVGIIALIVLILSILFGNLSGNVGFSQTTSTFNNQTITFSDGGSTPAGASGRVNGNITSIAAVTNATGGELLTVANYSFSGVTITANATSDYNATSVNVTYTVDYDSQGLIDTNNIILNYTLSGTNITAQLPTVGTIIGIAILLTVLIGILIFAITKMMGVAGTTTGGQSEGNFGGSKDTFR